MGEQIEQFKNDLIKHKRIGLDSMVFMYYFEGNRRFGEISEVIFDSAEKNELLIIASILILTEVLTGFRKAQNKIFEEKFMQMMEEFPNIEICNFNINLVDEIVKLRSKYNLKTPDAIHLATAIENKASVFITNDKRLKQVKEIKVVCLRDYVKK